MKTVEEISENYNSDQGLVFLIHLIFQQQRKSVYLRGLRNKFNNYFESKYISASFCWFILC